MATAEAVWVEAVTIDLLAAILTAIARKTIAVEVVATVAIAATKQTKIAAADRDCIVTEVNKAGKVAELSMEGSFDAFKANID